LKGVDWWMHVQSGEEQYQPSTVRLFKRLPAGLYVAMYAPDRQEQLAKYDSFVAAALADEAQPIWTYDGVSRAVQDLRDLRDVPVERRILFAPAALSFPLTDKLYKSSWRARMLAQAATAVIDVHLHRVRHGRWPHRLEDLDAPPLTIDMFTGRPLLYRLTPDGPLLYSVGTDRIDDGGLPAPSGIDAGEFIPPTKLAAQPKFQPAKRVKFDYVLYPPSKARVETAGSNEARE
ncbi:MAG: hypothetical protein K2Q20_07635, partial [Phycisphaerales bacterium]|nr:hypothetical protein [Phycisphaerales bacterium]